MLFLVFLIRNSCAIYGSVKLTSAFAQCVLSTIGPGKRRHIVADTLLPMMFLELRKLGNICCGHFLNKIRNIFCVPDTKFVTATNVRARTNGETFVSATMRPQQCDLVCQGLIVMEYLKRLFLTSV